MVPGLLTIHLLLKHQDGGGPQPALYAIAPPALPRSKGQLLKLPGLTDLGFLDLRLAASEWRSFSQQ